MIEIAKLTNVLLAEQEMAAAWGTMSEREKKAYVKAHPNSRYNSGDKKSSPNLAGHFEKHGWTKSGKNSYTHKNGRKIIIKNPTKAGKKFHIEVHHKNGDVTSHHRNTANNVGALIRHWGKANAKGHYKPRAYKVGTTRKRANTVAPTVAPKKRGRPAKYPTSPKGGKLPIDKPAVLKKRGRPPKAGNPQPIKSFKDLVKRHPELKKSTKIAAPVAKKPVSRQEKITKMAPVIKKAATKKTVVAPIAKKPVAKKAITPVAKKTATPITKPVTVKKTAPKVAAKPVAMKPAKKTVAPKVEKPAMEVKKDKNGFMRQQVVEKPAKKVLRKSSKEADW